MMIKYKIFRRKPKNRNNKDVNSGGTTIINNSGGGIDTSNFVKKESTIEQQISSDLNLTGNTKIKGELIEDKFIDKNIDETINGNKTFTNTVISDNGIKSTNYTSGVSGTGYKLSTINGKTSLELDKLSVRDSFVTNEMIVNKIRSTNGDLMVTDSAIVKSVGDKYIIYNGINLHVIGIDLELDKTTDVPFIVGDIIECKVFNGNSVKYYRYEVKQVDLTTGSIIVFMPNNGIAIGDTLVRVNSKDADRKGTILISSSQPDSPYVDVLYDEQVKTRLGKLDGIDGCSGYGLYSDNAFLTGQITNGSKWGLLKDGSGYLGNNGVTWDVNGNTKFNGSISTPFAKLEISNNTGLNFYGGFNFSIQSTIDNAIITLPTPSQQYNGYEINIINSSLQYHINGVAFGNNLILKSSNNLLTTIGYTDKIKLTVCKFISIKCIPILNEYNWYICNPATNNNGTITI